ncbi:MAG: Uncharacterized protein FD166_1878 [Bacteroidetes bacterium]|nr:MAG: Uncharacterized protein FD166_1878 [Bacteroidota bacterium]
MTAREQQTVNTGFFIKPEAPTKSTETDSIRDYSDFLVDSLNTFPGDTVFRFELREIVLPVQDSITAPAKPLFDKPSIFIISQSRQQKTDPEFRFRHNYDWLTSLFLVCLMVLAWIRFYHMRRIKQLFRAVGARHHVNQLVRDGNLTEERITPGLAFVYIISLAAVVLQLGFDAISSWLGIKEPSLIYMILLAVISVLWLLKILAIRGTGMIFRTKHDTGEFILTNIIFNAAAGIMIFPLVLAGFYSGNLLIMKIAAVILLIVAGLRFIRSMMVGFSAQTFSVLYLFLYLCTLEILPVLFLYRLVTIAD